LLSGRYGLIAASRLEISYPPQCQVDTAIIGQKHGSSSHNAVDAAERQPWRGMAPMEICLQAAC